MTDEDQKLRFCRVWKSIIKEKKTSAIIGKLTAIENQHFHDMFKKTFNEGVKFERKKNDIVELGGYD